MITTSGARGGALEALGAVHRRGDLEAALGEAAGRRSRFIALSSTTRIRIMCVGAARRSDR
jgi:hypothetical protein